MPSTIDPDFAVVYLLVKRLAFRVRYIVMDDGDLLGRYAGVDEFTLHIHEKIEAPVAALIGVAENGNGAFVGGRCLQILYDLAHGMIDFAIGVVR